MSRRVYCRSRSYAEGQAYGPAKGGILKLNEIKIGVKAFLNPGPKYDRFRPLVRNENRLFAGAKKLYDNKEWKCAQARFMNVKIVGVGRQI
jgi:hypothetical protein